MSVLLFCQINFNKVTTEKAIFSLESPLDTPSTNNRDAQFIGGDNAYSTFLAGNLHYPTDAIRQGIQGKVFVRFLIEKDGSIPKDCIKIAKSVHQLLDNESLRIVKIFPNWTPALKNGKPIAQYKEVPVKFKITK